MPLGLHTADEVKVYLICFTLGIGLLFAYNALLSEPLYLQKFYQFTAHDKNAVPQYAFFWINALSIVSFGFTALNIVTQVVNLTPWARRYNKQPKLLCSLLLMTISMVLFPLVSAFHVPELGSIVFVIIDVICCAVGSGLFCSTAMALISALPPKYTSIFVVGSAFSGIAANVLGIITKAALPENYEGTNMAGQAFFGAGAGVTFLTLAAQYALKHNPFAQAHIAEYRVSSSSGGGEGVTPDSLEEGATKGAPKSENESLLASRGNNGGTASRDKMTDHGATSAVAAAGDDNDDDETHDFEESTRRLRRASSHISGVASEAAGDFMDYHPTRTSRGAWFVFRAVFPIYFGLWMTYCVALMVMPDIGTAVDRDSGWFAIIIITLYNVGDFFGRGVTNWDNLWMPRRAVPWSAVASAVVIPLFILSVKQLIPGLIFPNILMFITGLTNGYIGGLCMIYAPLTEELDDSTLKDIAGNFSGLFLLVGCCSGAVFGLIAVTFL